MMASVSSIKICAQLSALGLTISPRLFYKTKKNPELSGCSPDPGEFTQKNNAPCKQGAAIAD